MNAPNLSDEKRLPAPRSPRLVTGRVPRFMPEMPNFPQDKQELARVLEELGADRLPGLLGIELLELASGSSRMRCVVEEKHLASNGYLHAASVVALADTAAGYGCLASLPD
ncbi:MAG: hypothetical protein M3N43_12360, partial [Actinomycetota bacterium]|nr:hypothetical protein [Actinomycetota bacterium]